MKTYWLITEPARGMSVRVEVPNGWDAEEALVEGFGGNDEAVAWLAHLNDEPKADISYKEWLEGSGYTVQYVTEG